MSDIGENMKHMKRANIYKASNVEFNPETIQATSYSWWRFVDVVNGLVVFNNYNYSNSTCKHQSKVRFLLSDLGIKIDYEIACPAGLQSPDRQKSITDHYNRLRHELCELTKKPRSHKRKNEERMAQMRDYLQKIKQWNRIENGIDL